MRINPFESDLERVARTLTDQFGVQVTCRGDEAWTDGKRIVLPSLPDPMSESLERMVVGYLDHEMAHVTFSDFKVVKEFSEKHPGYEAMLNVVEDALIEQRAMERWPGVRGNLDSMFAQVRERIIRLAAQRDAFGRFCTAVYLKLAHYRDMLGMDAEVIGYDDLLQEFHNVRNTRDSADLADKLLGRWLKNRPSATKVEGGASDESRGDESQGGPGRATEVSADAEPSPESNGSPASEPQSADSQEAPDAKPDNEQPGDTEASDSESPEHDGESDNGHQSDAKPVEPPSAPYLPEPGDAIVHVSRGAGGNSIITEAIAEAIGEHIAQLDSHSEYRVYAKDFDRIFTVSPAGDREVQEMLGKHRDVVRRLRRGLANALRSAEKRWWRGDQLRGELSSRALHRLCLDRLQLDVFRTRAVVQGRSTAVSIVLDASGSMTTNKMDVARDALRVLLQALEEIKVATEAITFTTGNDTIVFKRAADRGEDPNLLRQRFSRIANLEIGVVKRFEESVKTAMCRLPSIKGTGLTPLGEAMQVAARRLLPRRETRKIMLVLTDGRAGCESNDGSAVKHAGHVAKRIESAGMELIGVGILDESLRAIVADTIVVHQLEDLPAQLSKLLSRTLKKGLKHVG